jgi:hypothetical protein
VSGAVFTKSGILCDPITTASMLYNVYDYNHLETAARVVGAVTKAAKKLLEYYQKLNGLVFALKFI